MTGFGVWEFRGFGLTGLFWGLDKSRLNGSISATSGPCRLVTVGFKFKV